MEWKNNDKVQAVDECGRWEDGRVVDISGPDITVKFDGWSAEYNNTVDKTLVRLRVAPGNGELEVGGRGRQVTRNYLAHLRILTSEDIVNLDGEEVTVKYVDRFRRCVTVFLPNGGEKTVHAGTLLYEAEEDSEPKPKRNRSTKHNKLKGNSSRASTSRTQEVDNAKEQEQRLDPPQQQPESATELNTDEIRLFSCVTPMGVAVKVGDTFTTIIGVVVIRYLLLLGTSMIASCFPILNSKMEEEIGVRLPIRYLEDSVKLKLPLNQSRQINVWKAEAHQHQQSFTTFASRLLVRKYQLVQKFVKELPRAFRSHCKCHKFSIGLSSALDLNIFSLSFKCKKIIFNYSQNTLGRLDTIIPMWKRWDIRVSDSGVSTTFVTEVVVTYCHDDTVSIKIKTSQYIGELGNNYRLVLARDIAQDASV